MKPFSAFLYKLAKQLSSSEHTECKPWITSQPRAKAHSWADTTYIQKNEKKRNHYLRPFKREKDVLAQLHRHLKEPHPGHHQGRHLLSFTPSIILSQKDMCAIIRVSHQIRFKFTCFCPLPSLEIVSLQRQTPQSV